MSEWHGTRADTMQNERVRTGSFWVGHGFGMSMWVRLESRTACPVPSMRSIIVHRCVWGPPSDHILYPCVFPMNILSES